MLRCNILIASSLATTRPHYSTAAKCCPLNHYCNPPQPPGPRPAPPSEMSVAEYFRSTGRPLRHPGLPCANVGDRRRAVFIPVELCT